MKFKPSKRNLFANLVKKQVKRAAFKYLLVKKGTLSKMEHLNYNELKCQDYLLSKQISNQNKINLFRFRTRMEKSFAVNFRNLHQDLRCPLCLSSPDRQDHLLQHKNIVDQEPKENIKYEDIFSNDTDKMNEAIKLLTKVLEKRKEIIKNKSDVTVAVSSS